MSENQVDNIGHPKPSISNYDLTSMASEQFEQLDALFKLIASYANSKNLDNAALKSVARAGQYLCQSWGGLFEWEFDCIKHHQASSESENKKSVVTQLEPSITEKPSQPINKKLLNTALYELHELNSFVSDMSRILQQNELMNDEAIVTRDFKEHIGATLETASRKQLELFDIVMESIGINFQVTDDIKPRHKLLDMPTEVMYYYHENGGLRNE